ncbi:ABC transporter permease [Hamadaea tsunoensis]|uniref:ABC transporter permease n=1 Tax=Hamadaea tsunoensis TaxID=53368 RepID=UPI0003F76A07|nr:ABC transporter permease [Hamadaea tsunoensis]
MSFSFGTARLFRLEVRRSALPWLLPVVAILFWLIVYRRSDLFPPVWSIRARAMQTATVSVFLPIVVGAAAWMGGREARHGLTDLLASTVRSRWYRQVALWAATTAWSAVAYAVCVGALYVAIGRQASWGGPLWWPVAVGAACLPVFTALGLAAGGLLPGRFTAPLVSVAAFFALETSAQLIHGDHSPWQISPLVAGPWNGGADQDLATFYPYLSDLPRVQIAFLAGIAVVLVAALGLPATAGSRRQRLAAAALTIAGLATATTAAALAGTGRLDPHGMIAIPAVHDAAADRPVPFTPVCSAAAVPVCLHPAYAYELATVDAALRPVLDQLAGVPGAPVRVSQGAVRYSSDDGGGIGARLDGRQPGGDSPEFRMVLPNQLPGPPLNAENLAAAVRAMTARDIVMAVVCGGREVTDAQEAVIGALTGDPHAPPGSPVAQAAQRFATLPAADRHAWLVRNAAGLRTGGITLEQLP